MVTTDDDWPGPRAPMIEDLHLKLSELAQACKEFKNARREVAVDDGLSLTQKQAKISALWNETQAKMRAGTEKLSAVLRTK